MFRTLLIIISKDNHEVIVVNNSAILFMNGVGRFLILYIPKRYKRKLSIILIQFIIIYTYLYIIPG